MSDPVTNLFQKRITFEIFLQQLEGKLLLEVTMEEHDLEKLKTINSKISFKKMWFNIIILLLCLTFLYFLVLKLFTFVVSLF